MSSLPRLSTVKGLTWAPSRPDLPPYVPGSAPSHRFSAFSAYNSRRERYENDTFQAIWLCCFIQRRGFKIPSIDELRNRLSRLQENRAARKTRDDDITSRTIQEIISSQLKEFKWGAVSRPTVDDGSSNRFCVHALASHHAREPFHYEGFARGPLLAIVGSNDPLNLKNGLKWQWVNIFEWPDKVRLPEFEAVSIDPL